MPNTSKSRKKAGRSRQSNGAGEHESKQNRSTSSEQLTDLMTPLYLNTVTRTAEFQKNALSLAAEHTAEWIGAWKNAASHFPMSPPAMLFDIAHQAIQTSVETQKGALDLLVDQTEAMTEIAKERTEAYSKIAESASQAFQATVSRSVEAQKRVLASAGEQNKAMFEATRRRVGRGPSSALVDSFERGTDSMMRAQKSILDATTESFTGAEK